ncbi:MAG: outer membrane lipoprotein-sorting protein [Bacteriovoracaceae bacterium]|jgi:outer membrane lipoprotein-sorting protein
MFRAIIAFFFVLLLIDTASAASKFLPRAFKASFVQEKKSPISNKVKTNDILIKYQYSSNFYLKELSADTTYICNKTKVWLYSPPLFDGEKGLLKIGASNKYCYSKIFDSLKKGLTDNSLYKVKKGSNNSYTISFEPKAKAQLGISKMNMVFLKTDYTFQNISSLELFYTGEKFPVILKRKSFDVVKNFPKSTFTFKAPKNTEIQSMK